MEFDSSCMARNWIDATNRPMQIQIRCCSTANLKELKINFSVQQYTSNACKMDRLWARARA